MRLGIIGTGFGARVVAPVFAQTPGCTVVDVVSSRDPIAAERLCRRDDLDLISIHSPPSCHAPDARLALSRRHAVLCDKPFTLSPPEGDELVRLATETGVVNLVNFEFRHDPVRARLKSMIDDGAIGTPEALHWTALSGAIRRRPHGWLFEHARGGGWIGAWGSHAVDLIRWLFGEISDAGATRRLAVRSHADATGTERAADVEDGFTAWLRTASDVSCTLDSTGVASASLAHRLVVIGRDGMLENIGDRRLVLHRHDERSETVVAIEDGETDPHLAGMRAWAALVRDAVDGADRTVRPSFADGLACDVVLDRLRREPLSSPG
jgi:predicted dehydrogenase